MRVSGNSDQVVINFNMLIFKLLMDETPQVTRLNCETKQKPEIENGTDSTCRRSL